MQRGPLPVGAAGRSRDREPVVIGAVLQVPALQLGKAMQAGLAWFTEGSETGSGYEAGDAVDRSPYALRWNGRHEAGKLVPPVKCHLMLDLSHPAVA
jgi:hypothetical protein